MSDDINDAQVYTPNLTFQPGGGGGIISPSPLGNALGQTWAGTNTTGDEGDPFAYTLGSLLTPWTGQFNYTAPPSGGYFSGGGSFSPLAPFQYADFAYGFSQPDAFASRPDFQAPDAFHGSRVDAGAGFKSPVGSWEAPVYHAPAAFQAPNMVDDPGYQFRLDQGRKILERSAAAQGNLLSGGTLRSLQDYASGLASQEYANAYARRKGEYDTAAQLGLAEFDRNYAGSLAQNELTYNRAATEYDRNFANTMAVNRENYGRDASEYQTNFANAFNVYNSNFSNQLGAWKANADVSLQGQGLGYNIASGVWDRNYNKAQNAYNSMVQQAEVAAQIDAANAAAAAASAQWADETSYNRALTKYGLEYGAFTENQNNQFNRLVTLAGIGQGSANALTGAGANYAGNTGNLYTGAGNANASGIVGGANAYNSALGNIGNSSLTAALLGISLGRK